MKTPGPRVWQIDETHYEEVQTKKRMGVPKVPANLREKRQIESILVPSQPCHLVPSLPALCDRDFELLVDLGQPAVALGVPEAAVPV